MTDNTMREGKLWAFLRDSIHEAYKKLSTTGTSNEYHALLDSIASKVADDVDARFLQVAQSEQSVPVEVFDSHCNYASFAGRVCTKCGRIHDGGKSVAVVGHGMLEKAAEADELRKDAERYRWIRDKSHSLETRQYDKGIVNGPSCYHEVEGIRELKYDGALDDAIDAAIAQGKGE